jgi:hypothetical protein
LKVPARAVGTPLRPSDLGLDRRNGTTAQRPRGFSHTKMKAARSPFFEASGKRRRASARAEGALAAHPQERQHSAAEGGTRDRVRRAGAQTVGRGWIDVDRGVFYRRPPRQRETNKRQPRCRCRLSYWRIFDAGNDPGSALWSSGIANLSKPLKKHSPMPSPSPVLDPK